MKAVWIFVDCEGVDWVYGRMREFGAVEYESRAVFHGKDDSYETFKAFADWLTKFSGRVVLVSDNPAYDAGAMNMLFHKLLGYNPFGHSARRIGDYYAGLVGNWYETQAWKSLRVTKHDHNPVHDAMGNVEAFERLQKGERGANARPQFRVQSSARPARGRRGKV